MKEGWGRCKQCGCTLESSEYDKCQYCFNPKLKCGREFHRKNAYYCENNCEGDK